MMKGVKRLLCLFGVFLAASGEERLLVDQLRWDFLNLEDQLWNFVLDYTKNGGYSGDPGLALIEKFHSFDLKLQEMPQDILQGLQIARETKPFLILYSDLRVIHDMYEKFRRFHSAHLSKLKKEGSDFEKEESIADIIGDILHDPRNNANKTIVQLYFQVFGRGGDDNMIWDIFEILSKDDYYCKENAQPPQQAYYNLYNVVALTELKGYVMSQFAYMALRLQEKGNYTEASLLARREFERRANNTIAALGGAMKIVPRKLYRCDPKQWIPGETYTELTRLLQGHVQNEVDINERRSCTRTCDKYTETRSYGCYDTGSDYCRRMKACGGRILNCRFMESGMQICISNPSSSRRYEYIEYDSGKVLGDKKRCVNRSVKSWIRGFVHCSNCLCLCDEQGVHSDRYFNLRPVIADVANNRVVTGLRIVKHNRIIHLQIQEGKLLPYGFIDNATVRWVPVDDYKITDRDVKNGEDFHTMNYERRSLLLDELAAHEANHIVTGVRFEYIEGHLRFQINVRAFDFKSGNISGDSYYAYGTGSRLKLNIDNSSIPTESPANEPNWETNRYLQFTHSDFDKDAAQTTVPFFDTQPVSSEPAMPLKGAAIYYKGARGFGGFVAPKITFYDFSKHMQVQFPKLAKRTDHGDHFESTLLN